MAHRGNRPKPDPFSKCPYCECYFESTKSSCSHCGYKRGDLDKRARRKWQKPRRKDSLTAYDAMRMERATALSKADLTPQSKLECGAVHGSA